MNAHGPHCFDGKLLICGWPAMHTVRSCQRCHSTWIRPENAPRPNPKYDLYRCACGWLFPIWRTA